MSNSYNPACFWTVEGNLGETAENSRSFLLLENIQDPYKTTISHSMEAAFSKEQAKTIYNIKYIFIHRNHIFI